MRMRVEVEGLKTLVGQLRSLKKKAKKEQVGSVVSYSTPYASYVHEDKPSYNAPHHHLPPTQAKFLEEPARKNRKHMQEIISNAIKEGRSMSDAIYAAAVFLYEQSQLLVPVDTGRLKKSGRVRREERG